MASEKAQAADSGPRPIVPFLRLEPKPHLVGIRCSCGAIYVDLNRVACSRCGSAGPFEQVSFSGKGSVYVFSVVHQSFPGIPTPYITAIVDLAEGAAIRGNLLDFPPEQAQRDPHKVFGLPVEMVTRVVAKDREGRDVVAFGFRPAKR